MLKKRIIFLILILCLAIGYVLYNPSFYGQTKSYVENADFSKVFSQIDKLKQVDEVDINSADIIELTNKERVSTGLLPLSTNISLNASADLKVDDMIKRQYFEHQSPTGEGVSDLGNRVGYKYVIMGENLALGTFTSSADIVQAWMDSPGHRENILNTKYQEIGVSVKRGIYEGKEVWFAVQHFGTSRSICPSLSDDLKKQIDVINRELKIEEGTIASMKASLEAPGATSNPSYKSDVQAFNKKVDGYNAKLQVSRQQIEKYNAQVKDFNRCIATFQ